MEIKYLINLQKNPIRKGVTRNFPIIPVEVSEINQLEQLFNSGNPFPATLRELLYLAGKYCYFLDYGLNKNQHELQIFVRNKMHKNERIITRPFYAIDVYNGGDQFLFLYLDEGDNPAVYEGYYYDDPEIRNNWIIPVTNSLTDLINPLIERVKRGENPF